jgi:hypothetical protein
VAEPEPERDADTAPTAPSFHFERFQKMTQNEASTFHTFNYISVQFFIIFFNMMNYSNKI